MHNFVYFVNIIIGDDYEKNFDYRGFKWAYLSSYSKVKKGLFFICNGSNK